MTKYRIMTKENEMQIVGVPLWKDVYFDTEAEARAAIGKAREEINATWASPDGVPLWIEAVDYDRVRD